MKIIDLTGKTAVITGGGGGIGRGIAKCFAEAGANIAILDYNLETAEKSSLELNKLGITARAYQLDISKEEEVLAVMELIYGAFKSIDILCNAAGIVGDTDDYMNTSAADMEKTLRVNVLGTSYCVRAALKYMTASSDGKIIIISSIAGRIGVEDQVNYASSKAALISLTQSVAQVASKDNINVNCICPGYLRTDMWEEGLDFYARELGCSKDEAWKIIALDHISLGRAQEPEDIGNAAVFLASDLASNITGQSLNVCGGSVFN